MSAFDNIEAETFGYYMLKKKPSAFVVDLYNQAMDKLKINVEGKDMKLLNFMLRNKWSIGLIDAGLAFTNPHSVIRRKLLIMIAILECQPEYCPMFLTKNEKPVYILYIIWCGIRAVMKTIAGIILLKIIY